MKPACSHHVRCRTRPRAAFEQGSAWVCAPHGPCGVLIARRGRQRDHAGAPWRSAMTEPGNAPPPHGFLAELRRRRVIRIAIVYAIAGWVVIEVASTMLPGLNLPGWTVTLVIALVVLGFPIIFLMGWMFDLGPGGVVRTPPAGVPAATLVA